nr:MAG TPA: hypothetical protein [Caudoviricetes sp.]
MTKRRDRNRAARRRKRVYIWHWSEDEDPLYAIAAQIVQEIYTTRSTPHETLRARGVR